MIVVSGWSCGCGQPAFHSVGSQLLLRIQHSQESLNYRTFSSLWRRGLGTRLYTPTAAFLRSSRTSARCVRPTSLTVWPKPKFFGECFEHAKSRGNGLGVVQKYARVSTVNFSVLRSLQALLCFRQFPCRGLSAERVSIRLPGT